MAVASVEAVGAVVVCPTRAEDAPEGGGGSLKGCTSRTTGSRPAAVFITRSLRAIGKLTAGSLFDGRCGGGIGRYPAALVKQLPEEDVEWEYESCALVGNSGRLLAEENGAAIDQHDVRYVAFPSRKALHALMDT